jgi:hypothetical protein
MRPLQGLYSKTSEICCVTHSSGNSCWNHSKEILILVKLMIVMMVFQLLRMTCSGRLNVCNGLRVHLPGHSVKSRRRDIAGGWASSSAHQPA